MSETIDRYAGAPMVRFLDAYVLDAIGALDDATRDTMDRNVSRIRQALQVEGDTWQEVVETAMAMPDDAADGVRTSWEMFVDECFRAGQTPDALAWSHALVDARFRS
ncbi:hypothetical protein [Agrococcus jenensis]|uniref:Uncharacterized protein n=1 Tax=Agrococcus jenensis TaxID=46353 RepID=A0A3N2ARF3_9MICO|nr:hypothetical protein [Agrococcus jenensis]ROR65640.1 hypothetical protein EDD26_1009 [Agrococcus jenensis]